VKFDEFLELYLGSQPGDIVDAHTGDIIGRHNGLWFHTVGQRKGIGKVLNPKATSRGPWYVVAKDPEKRLIIASNQYDEDTFTAARSEFYVEDIAWISGFPPSTMVQSSDTNVLEGRFNMKIRHGPTLVTGSLRIKDLPQNDTRSGHIKLDVKDGGLAPGQFVAFYNIEDSECLGSGVISEQHWTTFLLKEDHHPKRSTSL